MDFAEFIEVERKKRGWSVGLLSEISGIPVPTIWRTIKGKTNPNPSTRKSIERAFGLGDQEQTLSDYDIIQNALLQCHNLDEQDRIEILGLVNAKLKRKAKQKAPPASYRGEGSGAGGG